MPASSTLVIGGVDCHLDTHHAVALDGHGPRLGDQAFATTRSGEAVRYLRVVRASAVKAHTAAVVELGELITTAPAAFREHLQQCASVHARVTTCARLRSGATALHQPLQAAKLALRSLSR